MQEIFNQADIDANRQGKLTPAQIDAIKAAADPKIWIWGTGLCLGLGLAGGWLLTLMGADSAVGLLGTILGLVTVFCAVRWVMIWNLRRKLLTDEILTAEGTVTFKKLDVTDMWRYSPETADGQRLLPQGLAGVSASLPPGRYRFYYLPTRHWLLSSDPLSSEAELIANLTGVLGSVFGFDPIDLHSLRAQVAAGEAKTVEGQPKIRTHDVATTDTDPRTEVYAQIGDVEFRVPAEASDAFIPELRYRVYYYDNENKPANFLSKILSRNETVYIAGIEPL